MNGAGIAAARCGSKLKLTFEVYGLKASHLG